MIGKLNTSRKALTKNDHMSAIADHVKTPHNITWDHFEILESCKTDYLCKIKETLFIQYIYTHTYIYTYIYSCQKIL